MGGEVGRARRAGPRWRRPRRRGRGRGSPGPRPIRPRRAGRAPFPAASGRGARRAGDGWACPGPGSRRRRAASRRRPHRGSSLPPLSLRLTRRSRRVADAAAPITLSRIAARHRRDGCGGVCSRRVHLAEVWSCGVLVLSLLAAAAPLRAGPGGGAARGLVHRRGGLRGLPVEEQGDEPRRGDDRAVPRLCDDRAQRAGRGLLPGEGAGGAGDRGPLGARLLRAARGRGGDADGAAARRSRWSRRRGRSRCRTSWR